RERFHVVLFSGIIADQVHKITSHGRDGDVPDSISDSAGCGRAPPVGLELPSLFHEAVRGAWVTPTIVLLLAAVAASDPAATSQPSELPAEARKLQPLARTVLGRTFLKAAEGTPPYAPRTVYRRGKAREWLGADAFAKLTAAERGGRAPVGIGED